LFGASLRADIVIISSTVALNRSSKLGAVHCNARRAMKRLIVGLSGASGVVFGVRLLEVLKGVPQIETHLVVSKGAEITLRLETEKSLADVKALADVVYDPGDLAASVSAENVVVFYNKRGTCEQ
jgi:hypothetical protein